MDAADWWARGLSIAGVVISAVAMRLTWRWRRAHGLLGLHESLRKLKSTALQHLDVHAGEYPTEGDVRDLLEDSAYLTGRVRWNDVRETAERLLEECKVVLEPRVRERPIERKDALRRNIQEAFDSASATIGARADTFSVRGLTGQRRSVRR